jgi:cation diffusion facilitator CzcD-associated flavoprotein CzcO
MEPHGKAFPRVVIVGAGLAGLCMGIRLKKAGIDDFTIVDKYDNVGGTWYANNYPGAACDVPIHLYSYSFEQNPKWSRLYPEQPEILRYLEMCVEKYDLGSHLRLSTTVDSARWDEDRATWTILTSDGQQMVANVMITAVGLLDVPSEPDFPGLKNFPGPTFHSARWDHSFDPAGKRVAVIGTGSSAIQVVPAIAPVAERVDLFQREPGWVLPRGDRALTERERRYYQRFSTLLRLARFRTFCRLEKASRAGIDPNGDPVRNKTTAALEYLARSIADPELRARVTPGYPLGCKRLLITDDFYPALARDNVELVTSPIEHITANGVLTADGREHPVDAIVLATGFQAPRLLSTLEITGRSGLRLHDAWRDGAEAHWGITTAGFPNMFMLYGPNTNLRNSIIFGLECQAGYTLQALRLMTRQALASLEVRPEAMARSNEQIQIALGTSVWKGGCHNYFAHPSGKIVTQWPYSATRYWRSTRRLRPADFASVPRRPQGPVT